MLGEESWRNKNQKLIHVIFDSHSSFWSSFANIPITNEKDDFTLTSSQRVAQRVVS